jgi:hypothetical protein
MNEVNPALGASVLMRADIERLRELASRGDESGLNMQIAYIKGMLQMLEWVAGENDARELTACVTSAYLDAIDECLRVRKACKVWP